MGMSAALETFCQQIDFLEERLPRLSVSEAGNVASTIRRTAPRAVADATRDELLTIAEGIGKLLDRTRPMIRRNRIITAVMATSGLGSAVIGMAASAINTVRGSPTTVLMVLLGGCAAAGAVYAIAETGEWKDDVAVSLDAALKIVEAELAQRHPLSGAYRMRAEVASAEPRRDASPREEAASEPEDDGAALSEKAGR